MPLVCPFHEVILFIAIPFLGFADELVVIALDLLQVVIRKLAIFLFQLTFELHPFSLELICVHDVLLLCKMSMSPSVSICPLHLLSSIHYGEKIGSVLVKIAQVIRINPAATWRCLGGRIISNKSIFMQDDEEGIVPVQFTVVVNEVQYSEYLQKETDGERVVPIMSAGVC